MTIKPSDVGKLFLAACLFVSALYTGLYLKDWHAAQMLAESGAGVLGVAAFAKLNQGQKAITARIDGVGARAEEIHSAVNAPPAIVVLTDAEKDVRIAELEARLRSLGPQASEH